MHHHVTGLVADILRLLVTAFSVLVVGKVLPGITVKSYGSAVWFAFVVAILNAIVWHFWPFKFMSYAFTLGTLGIGALILNGIIFLVADKFSSGIEISGCFMAAIASFCVTVLNTILEAILHL
ncbi:MAG TPA: phage holin family protein [Minicystis sp.]|nr:phage holin family protein [Minicystis sp.]